jgi:hypothetical protein
MPTYGRCFTLSNSAAASGIGAPASGPCPAGSYTGQAGFLAYYEVLKSILANSCNTLKDSERQHIQSIHSFGELPMRTTVKVVETSKYT